MVKFFKTFVGVVCAGICLGASEQQSRSLWIATRSVDIAIDGAFTDWEAIEYSELEMDGFRLKTAWDKKRVYLLIQAKGEEGFWDVHGSDYFDIGIDLKNDSDFSYELDDFHFLVSVPDRDSRVPASLIRSGAGSVETDKVIQVVGERADQGYRIEMAISLERLGGEPLALNRSVGFQIERRGANAGPRPFLMPILWGDLGMANEHGVLSAEKLNWIEMEQSVMAERFRDHQSDPPKPEHLDEKTRKDLERLTERFIELQEEDITRQEVVGWLESQQSVGKWPDLEYGPTEEVSLYSRMLHLYRLRKLAYAREKMNLGQCMNDKILDAVLRGMDYKIEENLYYRNWHYNEIGYPLEFARIGLYLRDELVGERRDAVIRILNRSSRPMTGQNLIWINKITMIRGLLQENPELVERSIERIAKMVRVEEGEGLQADFSFHQHGSQLYSHGYGARFVSDLTEVIYMAHGGRFQFTDDKRELILGMLLDGNRWMSRGEFADFAALGRNVSVERKDSSYLVPVAKLWLRIGDGREQELHRLIASAKGDGPDLLEGNRYFFRSEFMVHRRKGFYASVKAYSKRLTGTESINGQGLKSYYLPDGATLFLREGDEYDDIQPVWDWRRIPGVTGIVSDDPVPLLNHRVVRTKGNTNFVGGVSDGWRGAATYDYQRDEVGALKSYFGFDWGMVMLGANIRSAREEPLQTAVEQNFSRGQARILRRGKATEQLQLGDLEFEPSNEPIGILHDGAFYYLAADQSISISNKSQSGSWLELRRTGSPDMIERNVFSITLSHGVRPKSDHYEYAVIDAEIESRALEALNNKPYRVLANDDKVQAVSDSEGRHSQLVFHESGDCKLLGGLTVSVSRPCVLLVTASEDSEYVLTVADPSRVGGELIVELEDGQEAKGEAVFNLARLSLLAGDSESMRIRVGR